MIAKVYSTEEDKELGEKLLATRGKTVKLDRLNWLNILAVEDNTPILATEYKIKGKYIAPIGNITNPNISDEQNDQAKKLINKLYQELLETGKYVQNYSEVLK